MSVKPNGVSTYYLRELRDCLSEFGFYGHLRDETEAHIVAACFRARLKADKAADRVIDSRINHVHECRRLH